VDLQVLLKARQEDRDNKKGKQIETVNPGRKKESATDVRIDALAFISTRNYFELPVSAVQVLEQRRAVGFRRQKTDHCAVSRAAAFRYRGPEEAAGVFAEQAGERGVPI